MRPLDDTHDPQRRSWVASANGATDFPIQNLPLGVFARDGSGHGPSIGVAIGDQILDLRRCRDGGILDDLPTEIRDAACSSRLNGLGALGPSALRLLRARVGRILDANGRQAEPAALVPMSDARLLLPFEVGDYSDFYTSIHHATNVGHMFRSGDPLFPNFKHLPVGYHGRSSSIVPSGTLVHRPHGQCLAERGGVPVWRPSARLDYELEIGAFVGCGNRWGEAIALANAEDHLFGLCLLNDWSARDIQTWESQPLGPFLAKSFATTVSPWVVTLEALAPFRSPAATRDPSDPSPLPYLQDPGNAAAGGFDIVCEVSIASAAMRAAQIPPYRISANAFRDMYWTIAQMLAHQTSNGCNVRPGDLLGSGTVSGAAPGTLGCLLERTREAPIALPTGETRTYLADGDEVTFRAHCRRPSYVSIGFGECRGVIATPVRTPAAQ
ncbi:MAG: fumarylacetoacetase [Vicinamibacterales bacterium]